MSTLTWFKIWKSTCRYWYYQASSAVHQCARCFFWIRMHRDEWWAQYTHASGTASTHPRDVVFEIQIFRMPLNRGYKWVQTVRFHQESRSPRGGTNTESTTCSGVCWECDRWSKKANYFGLMAIYAIWFLFMLMVLRHLQIKLDNIIAAVKSGVLIHKWVSMRPQA